MLAVEKIWGLEERICRNDFKRMLFKYLVQSVMEYEVEIWEEIEELEKIMLD